MNLSTAPVHTNLVRAAIVLLAATSLFACSKSDADKASSGSGTPTTAATTQESVASTTATPSDGTPTFTSFDVSPSVPCESGNATATMSFTTENVESIEISIGGGEFASTAGYGPNESDVVASIPCSGAGTSTIQLKGCSGTDECATSDEATVDITAAS